MSFNFTKIRPDKSPIIIGILNVTPDSFSDGGKFYTTNTAVDRAIQMFDEGADVVDIGGESSRPGSKRISAVEEARRVIPVVKRVKFLRPDGLLSIDTQKPEIARMGLCEGADIINDITGGQNQLMLETVKTFNAGMILMHMQGQPETMQTNPTYDRVVEEVKSFLAERHRAAKAQLIDSNSLAIDPGIGFGKSFEHNLGLLKQLKHLNEEKLTIVLGTSRKKFLQTICNFDTIEELIGATCATTALGVQAGAGAFRVHDVAQNRQAADVAWKIHNL